MRIKRFTFILLVLVFATFMFGCTENKVSRGEAKEQVNLLIDAISNGNFEEAEKLLHPSEQVDLEAYFNEAEKEYGVDFQSGIELVKYTNFSSSLYDSEVQGGDYELDAIIKVGTKRLELTVEVVRNDLGFGIYEIDIDD